MHENEKEYFDQRLYQTIILPLINARKQAGITQKRLAEMTGLEQAAISRMEKGAKNPSLKTLLRITEALELRLKIEQAPISNHKKT